MSGIIETSIDELLTNAEDVVMISKKTVGDMTVKFVFQDGGTPPILPNTEMVSLDKLLETETALARECDDLGGACVKYAESLYDHYMEAKENVADESAQEFCELARSIKDWKSEHDWCGCGSHADGCQGNCQSGHLDDSHGGCQDDCQDGCHDGCHDVRKDACQDACHDVRKVPWWEGMIPLLDDYKFLLMWGTSMQVKDESSKMVNALCETAWNARMAMRDEKIYRAATRAAVDVGREDAQIYLPRGGGDTIYILVWMG